TSLAAAFGLLLTAFGVRQADPIAGLLISIAILYILVDVGREVFYRLMDAVEPAVVEQIRAIALATPGVQDVQDIRARWSGRRLYIAMNIGADANSTLAEAHAVAERVRQETLAHVTGAALVDIHVDPMGLPSDIDPHAWLHDHAAHDHAHDDHDTDDDHDAHPHHDAAHDHTHNGGDKVDASL
ncbi:MAG: cation transporter dimerization domain-containing protein, partial [Ktedonobacterales bacterium]